MSGRTFAIGDIHGELEHLFKLLSTFPLLDAGDTIVTAGQQRLQRDGTEVKTMDVARPVAAPVSLAPLPAPAANVKLAQGPNPCLVGRP